MYASGPYTRLCFLLDRGDLVIAVPRKHALGERGDMVNTIVTFSHRTHRLI